MKKFQTSKLFRVIRKISLNKFNFNKDNFTPIYLNNIKEILKQDSFFIPLNYMDHIKKIVNHLLEEKSVNQLNKTEIEELIERMQDQYSYWDDNDTSLRSNYDNQFKNYDSLMEFLLNLKKNLSI
jgi:hypothetical protein